MKISLRLVARNTTIDVEVLRVGDLASVQLYAGGFG